MKRYYNRYTTPLIYHTILHCVGLPVGFLGTLGRMYMEFAKATGNGWYYTLDGLYNCAYLVLALICFIGFCRWKAYGWYGIITLQCINIVYSLIVALVYAKYLPEQNTVALGQLLGSLIYGILTTIYYMKRKPLFFPAATAAPPSTYSAPGASGSDSLSSRPQEGAIAQSAAPQEPVLQRTGPQAPVPQEPLSQRTAPQAPMSQGPVLQKPVPQEPVPKAPIPQVAFCRKCGSKLLPDSDFCSYCGAKVIRGGEG